MNLENLIVFEFYNIIDEIVKFSFEKIVLIWKNEYNEIKIWSYCYLFE